MTSTLSAIDPSLLEPVGSRGERGQGSKIALLFGAVTATVVVSLEPVQHWLTIRVGECRQRHSTSGSRA